MNAEDFMTVGCWNCKGEAFQVCLNLKDAILIVICRTCQLGMDFHIDTRMLEGKITDITGKLN